MQNKRSLGQYFTKYSPFSLSPFTKWERNIDISNQIILEPFAGENSLIKFLINNGLCNRYTSFDIEPKAIDVHYRDTLKDFPIGFEVCVTNPPWLAKNSATKMQVPFYAGEYDDLYKYSLSKCLDNCKEASIRFCDPKELQDYEVEKHGRHITILDIPFKPKIKDYNHIINNFRQDTQDVLMTSYRGIRKDGFYRRRLDWQLAKDIICCVA